MEQLHTRLYDKYRNLKKRRLSEASDCNAKVQGEFEKYLTAVESMIEDLKSENSQLREKISSLEDSQAEYQQTLMEENRKVEELSSEVERLRNVASAEDHRSIRPQGGEIVSLATPTSIAKDGYLGSDERIDTNLDNGLGELPPKVTDTIQHDNRQNEHLMPDCCGRKMINSDGKEKDYVRCIYQMLIESLVGMKFAVENQADDMHLSVVHQSSAPLPGLLIGTIEKVALDWMKEDLLFSMAMCHSFFDRISRVLGRHTWSSSVV
ncbi:unnamed protein product [Spirodela intermedia]|uniref:DUF7806 domain-containing protein n=1 Tax=Spirodela intermedia TaxID=51605 RepID=A0A7I8I8M1_SPIIN|nr:unnamed protein product [Spirodela intermedia]CAA6653979.1 unnamed protein product [Spirodela intermedia]